MDRTKDISPRPDEVTVGGCWNSNAVIALHEPTSERRSISMRTIYGTVTITSTSDFWPPE
jgi:hypothetical protein